MMRWMKCSRGLGVLGLAILGSGGLLVAIGSVDSRAAESSTDQCGARPPEVSGVEADRPRGAPHEESDVLVKALGSVDPSLSPQGRRLDTGWRPVARTIAAAIAKACEPDVDLLVAGSRSPLDRALLGSVTSHLVDSCPCPVLVVPRR